MIRGLGVDIESVNNFKKAKLSDSFLKLIFTEDELRYCKKKKSPHISLAGKFCAKEAFIKAYPKQISMKDIEITNLKSGKIAVKVKGKINRKVHCSIAHSGDYALAFVIIER